MARWSNGQGIWDIVDTLADHNNSPCTHCSCGTANSNTSTTAPVPKFANHSKIPRIPWFDWIAKWNQKYEGRLWKDDWANLAENDVIVFISPTSANCPAVSSVCPFRIFFGAAWCTWAALVPVPGVNTADVVKIYGQYYKDEDVQAYGVVAVEVEPIKCL